jgi:alpha-beta hydrolase superfamily lysophospholipase
MSDPKRWSTNWNRTFELPSDRPTSGVLLLHGMSDSPYSLRNIGQRLNAEGAWVVGLRLPGHGTAPAGLVRTTWEDMGAAVLLAVRHLYEKIDERPLAIVGYSTGGALGVHYALSTLKDPELPKIDRLVLVSPSIGVTPVAILASWQARLGRLLGADKLVWNSILPEYDPFKYGSFAVNAGDQVYRLTSRIKSQLMSLVPGAALDRFPPVMAFQSVVDATVSTRAVVDLFLNIPPGGHELVLFDINRHAGIERMMTSEPLMQISDLLTETILPFRYSFVTNQGRQNQLVVVRRKKAHSNNIVEEPLRLKWPERVYSLSHVALPFPMDDSLYGLHVGGNEADLHLGKIAPRGERGLLQISDSDMLRLRSNPFYDYIEKRVLEFLRNG